MHILEIPSFFPPYGGLFCLDQAKALAALGHEVRIVSNVQLGATIGLKDYLTLPFSRYEHRLDGITVCQCYQRGIPRLIQYNVNRWVHIVNSMFDEYVSKYGKPDILHAHCGKWAGYAAMNISRKHDIPYVVTEHLPRLLLEDEYGKAPSDAWQIPLLKEVYRQADMVIPVSEELVDDIACYYGKDYHWQYVSNTIDTDFFCYQPRASREGRAFSFCCMADYCYRKGYDILFAALRQLQELGMDVELHIAGLFTDGRKCHAEIERMGLKGVKTYGRIDKQHVRTLLCQCDALVLASRSEVQPLVLLEAMSTGVPVISTECTPRSLRIKEGCTIVAVDDVQALTDAMRQVASPASTIDGKKLSESVRQLASPSVVGQQLQAIFRDIVGHCQD